jgi:hypothetical protein
MSTRITLACTGAFALLCGGFLAFPAADTQDSAKVSQMLSETKTMAFQLKEDALTMESYSLNNVSREAQATSVNNLKEHINALGRQVTRLKGVEGEASPWQKTAIERINPYLDEMVGYTTAVIEHLNRAPQHNFAEYKDYLEANADYATDLSAMISDFVSYGNAKHRVEHLGSKLEIEK